MSVFRFATVKSFSILPSNCCSPLGYCSIDFESIQHILKFISPDTIRCLNQNHFSGIRNQCCHSFKSVRLPVIIPRSHSREIIKEMLFDAVNLFILNYHIQLLNLAVPHP